ncbi:unnamed protein product [Cylicocyclus nassatus]|uniref:Annexin n=1 Tax=Cylicocyclus nassatus TaxID=53992 RepID=A0AA36DVV5_CYLNA|nr:unnamed protein product [Cylicocyclus nassatus]
MTERTKPNQMSSTFRSPEVASIMAVVLGKELEQETSRINSMDNTDEVVEFLCSRTNWQRQEIAQAFQSLYGEELTKHLMSDFNADFKDIILALMEPTSVYDARQLHKAVKGMSTNESVLIECMTYMTSRNNQQISEVRRVYKELYNVDPTKDLTVGNHGLQDHLASLCAHGKADNFSSLGTSKSCDFYRAREEVATRNLHDINVQRTENTYNQRSAVTEESHNVREHHINTSNFSSETRNYQAETSYSNEHHIRTEAGLQYGHPSQMYNPYETRPSVTEKTYGDNRSSVETDESLLSHILSAGSMQELRKIFDGYQKESMQTIEKAIESQFSGYIRDGLLAAVGVSRNKPAYFAKLLYEALNNRDSKINDLIRLIVSRSEYDMVDIRKQFQELYKTSLEEMIKAKCSGICKDVLVALVRAKFIAKVMYPFRILLLLLVVCYCIALECYTGIKYIKGRSMGTSTKKCERPSDFCYNVSLDLTQFNEITMAGCSTNRCMLSPNKCIRQNLLGHEIVFCCCNTGDLCNSKLTNLTTYEKLKERAKDIFKGLLNIKW